jgi:hypothetical protein
VLSFKYVIKSFRSFSFLRPPNAIFVPGMYFLGFSRYVNRVSSFLSIISLFLKGEVEYHVMPFCLLASVYWKPSTCPVFRPNNPCKLSSVHIQKCQLYDERSQLLLREGYLGGATYFGPTLFPPAGSVV